MPDAIPLGAPASEGDLRLPHPPGVIRRFWARHPWVTDSLIAGLYFAMALLVIGANATTDAYPPWALALGIVVPLISAAALLFRRHRPYTVLFVMWGTTLALIALPNSLDTVSIPLALYAVAVYRSSRAAWIGFAGSLVVGTLVSVLTVMVRGLQSFGYGSALPAATSQFGVVMLIAVLIGINVGNRKRYVEALVARAEQLARERDQQAIIAAAGERARIAREMHDIVSHSITVMVTLADGSAAIVGTAPERAATAMNRLAETGRAALGDMRRMLGVLGSPTDGALTPQPGAEQLDALLETYRATGLPVTLTTSGPNLDDPARDLAVYRLVQESLTNALRHASGPSWVRVEVRHENDVTSVEISNDGGVAAPAASGGHGLIGMRERVALYGGTLESGPRPSGGGWRVRAELPREENA